MGSLGTILSLALVSAPPLGLGEVAPDARFKDARFLLRALHELESPRGLAIVFIRLNGKDRADLLNVAREWNRRHSPRGLRFALVGIDPNDSIPELAEAALAADIPFPVLKDVDLARSLGVADHAAIVLLDNEKRLRFRGRVNVHAQTGSDPVLKAVELLMAGRPIDVPSLPADHISVPPSAPLATDVREEEVEAVFRKHCHECHRPGGESPFSLVTSSERRAQAEAIAEAVDDRRMPPWHGGPSYQEFVNRRGLSPHERSLLINWARRPASPNQSSAENAPSDSPDRGAARRSRHPWLIDDPDLIITAAQPHDLPAQGIIPYRYVILPHVFKEDTWISQAQILPSNPKVVHHCNMGYVKTADLANLRHFDPQKIGALLGKVPGVSAMRLKDGLAMMIPKGAVLGMQIHYTTTGKPEQNRMSVGFRFPRETVRRRGRHLIVTNRQFAIAPHDSHFPVADSTLLPHDAIGIGLFAHMHVRGKDMTFRAIDPDGSAQTLLRIPNYHFDWQQEYLWAFGSRRFPKNTRIECVAHYDNSAFNPFNPDPTKTVRDGPQTDEEMFFGFLFYADAHENLNIVVDPKTGYAIARQGRQP